MLALSVTVADFSYSMDRLPGALLGCAAYSMSGHGVSHITAVSSGRLYIGALAVCLRSIMSI